MQQHLYYTLDQGPCNVEPCRGQQQSHLLHSQLPHITEGLLLHTHNFLPTHSQLNTHTVLGLLSTEDQVINTHKLPIADTSHLHTHTPLASKSQLHTHTVFFSTKEKLIDTHKLQATAEGQPHTLNTQIRSSAPVQGSQQHTHISLTTENQLNTQRPSAIESKLHTHISLGPATESKLNTQRSSPVEGQLHTHKSLGPATESHHHTQRSSALEAQLNTSENQLTTHKFLPTESKLSTLIPLTPKGQPNTKRIQPYTPEFLSCSRRLEPTPEITAEENNTQEEGSCRRLVDHLSSIDKVALRSPSTIASSAEMITASTELCMMGWKRFSTSPPAPPNVPAKVAPLHRQIIMINNPSEREIDSVYSSLSDNEVCLELNIGPSKGGLHAGAKKTLQDIHSEERSGFSKWQRPEPTKSNVAETGQCLCNAGRTCWPEDLDVKLSVTDAGAPDSPLRFCLGSSNLITIPPYTRTSSDCNVPTRSADFMSKNHDTPTTTCLHVRGQVNHSRPSTPPFFGLCTMTESSHHESTHAHKGRLLPTNMLLQAAFPSEISSKSRKLDNAHQNPTSRRSSANEIDQESLHNQIAQSSLTRCNGGSDYVDELTHLEMMKTDKEDKVTPELHAMMDLDRLRYHGLSTPPRLLRPIDTPNVQERSLVEFLHAKKQHRDHFLDKVVVKEDVYQSHPWHFTGGGREGPGGGGGGSLYFCCSTKYTKRGNMTRNRMTREGGRWKQQGMVQPIFYADVEAAHKTYLSYIPRGSCSSVKGRASFFVNLHINTTNNTNASAMMNSTPGRLKHRHRMIEIALQEDLHLEKRSFQLKVTPKPFLVVCVLRNTT